MFIVKSKSLFLKSFPIDSTRTLFAETLCINKSYYLCCDQAIIFSECVCCENILLSQPFPLPCLTRFFFSLSKSRRARAIVLKKCSFKTVLVKTFVRMNLKHLILWTKTNITTWFYIIIYKSVIPKQTIPQWPF